MSKWKTLSDIRREYGLLSLLEKDALPCPFEQFKLWFEQVLDSEKNDPTAMLLSTVDEKGYPDSRVVLLKSLQDNGFVFYSNYLSSKGIQLNQTPYAALNFYWPGMARQVRIRGRVKQLASPQSDEYFASRPLRSQLSAIASSQSKPLKNRDELEKNLNDLIEKTGSTAIVRPLSWGGYIVLADEFEFWQGRDNRLHDRIHYIQSSGVWTKRRLAP